MTAPAPEIIEARKWCIERAMEQGDGPDAWPALAAMLIGLVETGRLPAPGDEPQPGTARPIPFNPGTTVPGDESAPMVAPATASRTAAEDIARSDLSDREQAVLDALMTGGPGGWPSHAQLSEASGVPRGSLTYLLERLHAKGYLARPNGKWAVGERAAQ